MKSLAIVALGILLPAMLSAQANPYLNYHPQTVNCFGATGPEWISAYGPDNSSTIQRNGKMIPAVKMVVNTGYRRAVDSLVLVPKDTLATICTERRLIAARIQDSANRSLREQIVAAQVRQHHADSVEAIRKHLEDSLDAIGQRQLDSSNVAIAAQEARDAKALAAKQKAAAAKAKADWIASVNSHGWPQRVVDAILTKKIFVGMTAEQARMSWGKPQTNNKTVTAAHVHEQWVYGSGQYLYIDDGILTSFQTSN
jgi:hypothetical protein